MDKNKGLIEFILTNRHFSLIDKIEYFLYRFSSIVYTAIFLYLIYEKFMNRINLNWIGFLVLLTSPLILFAGWSRRVKEEHIEPYNEELKEEEV